MTQRVYVDCEFDGFAGELLSMALVAEDGREWYGVLPVAPGSEWVLRNVVPLIDALPVTLRAYNRVEFNLGLFNFLRGIDSPVIVADWYTDLVHFFRCFEGPDHASSFSMDCAAELRPKLDISSHSQFPHNALSDARALAVVDRLRLVA